ncbi:tail fiber domain-containing protein [Xanthobacter sp. DSM 24535]|uniref:tail fiber domain-containing protein n=1 Tax=Roseixanthobacter psychrophilus TaxID=3119917 RepID=UPI00372A3D24
MSYDGFYNVGTVSVASGGTAVTGVGTAWTIGSKPVVAGDSLSVGGMSLPIAAVVDDTHLTLAYPAPAAATTAAYAILLNSESRTTAGAVAARLRDYLAAAARIENGSTIQRCVGVLVNTPPGSPATDDLYVVGTSPTGAWTGLANQILKWTGSAWYLWAPEDGNAAMDLATSVIYVWSDTTGSWSAWPFSAGALRYDTAQSLSSGEKTQVTTNAGAVPLSGDSTIAGNITIAQANSVYPDTVRLSGVGAVSRIALGTADDYQFVITYDRGSATGSISTAAGGAITFTAAQPRLSGGVLIGPADLLIYQSATGVLGIRSGTSGAERYFNFDASGNGNALSGSWVSASDERLKDLIEPLSGALAKIVALSGKSFLRHGRESREIGLIAQEVQAVYPEAVYTVSGQDGNEYLGVDYGALVGPLVEAIKILESRVSSAEDQITTLVG